MCTQNDALVFAFGDRYMREDKAAGWPFDKQLHANVSLHNLA